MENTVLASCRVEVSLTDVREAAVGLQGLTVNPDACHYINIQGI